ncbi:MAG: ribonuclease P protein component [Deltaproteobacteria bacterium]|nr:ribonuclease P protein component [Deltaproteobacteria bacterium]
MVGAGAPVTLKDRRDFVRVQSTGRRFRDKHLLLMVAPGNAGTSRVGITVSRKVGKAVVRNRVRRRLREILRGTSVQLVTGCDHVVVAFPQAAGASFVTLREELTCLLSYAGSPSH